MALTRTYLKAQPVSNDQGRAALQLLDGQVGGNYSRVTANASDAGAIVALSVQDGQVMAHPVAVGTTTVTFSAFEAGVQVTGTATLTVTLGGNGRLQAAWTTGNTTVH